MRLPSGLRRTISVFPGVTLGGESQFLRSYEKQGNAESQFRREKKILAP
jgi:hypothetical protein